MGGDIDPNSKLTDSKAFLIIVKCFVGGGMLSLPFALAHAGLVLGVSCLLIFALMSIQGILMLAECSQLLQREKNFRVGTYPQLAAVVSGSKFFGSFVSLTVCLTQLGVCCVMVNFVATNILAILPCETRNRIVVTHGNDEEEYIKIIEEPQCFGMEPLPAKRSIIGMVLPVFIALSWLPSMKALAPLAKVANYFMMFTILVIMFYAARSYYYVGLATSCVAWPTSLESFSLFIGNCFYSFEGVATMIPLCAAMENQGSVKRVMRNALFCILGLQLTVAVACYVSFQDIDNASMTAVLASNRRIEVPIYTVLVTNCFVITAVVFTFPLQLFPAMQLLESFFGIGKKPPAHAAPDEQAKKLSGAEEQADGEGPVGKGAYDLDYDDPDPFRRSPYADPFDRQLIAPYADSDDDEFTDGHYHVAEKTARCLPCCQLVFRTFVVIMIGGITYMIPDLGLIVDLFGAVFGSTLAIIVPNYLSIKSARLMSDPSDIAKQNSAKCRKMFVMFIVFCCALLATKAVLAEMQSGEVHA